MPADLIAGVMCGTSADAIDVALVEAMVEPRTARLAGFYSLPLRPAERRAMLAAAGGGSSIEAVAKLHFSLGRRIGEAVLAACAAASIPPRRLRAIASHGFTVFHQGGVATLQLGAPAAIAAAAGLPVVSDFRSADVAAGGQGAPLVPFLDWRLLRHPRRYRVALNLGGIANITLLPPGIPAAGVLAFDTGPGNMVLDALARHFHLGPMDRGGRTAAAGTVIAPLLRRLLRDAYYRLPPPKSTGRERFGAPFLARLLAAAPGAKPEHLLATATALTAHTVARGLAWGGPAALRAEVIVSGGGARNPALLRALAAAAPHCVWRRSDELGLPAQAKEAIAFALLGDAFLRHRPLPAATGARYPALLGSYTPAPILRR